MYHDVIFSQAGAVDASASFGRTFAVDSEAKARRHVATSARTGAGERRGSLVL
jgi:hypothetical protein